MSPILDVLIAPNRNARCPLAATAVLPAAPPQAAATLRSVSAGRPCVQTFPESNPWWSVVAGFGRSAQHLHGSRVVAPVSTSLSDRMVSLWRREGQTSPPSPLPGDGRPHPTRVTPSRSCRAVPTCPAGRTRSPDAGKRPRAGTARGMGTPRTALHGPVAHTVFGELERRSERVRPALTFLMRPLRPETGRGLSWVSGLTF